MQCKHSQLALSSRQKAANAGGKRSIQDTKRLLRMKASFNASNLPCYEKRNSGEEQHKLLTNEDFLLYYKRRIGEVVEQGRVDATPQF